MRRRGFIVALGAALLARAASARNFEKQPYRIGFLSTGQGQPAHRIPALDAFRQAMREHGWTEGSGYVIEVRGAAGQSEKHAAQAAELEKLGVDVFLALQTPGIRAAMQASRTTPIVMVLPADPVREGLIASYARPGGNVTGLSSDAGASLFIKQMDLLRQIRPGLARVAMLFPEPVYAASRESEIRKAAEGAGMQLRVYRPREFADVPKTFAQIIADRMQAVMLLVEATLVAKSAEIAQLAIEHRLPLASQHPPMTHAGGLLSYSTDALDLYRRAAGYVDKIFRGARPSELPVEMASTYRLTLNLRTAKSLGISIPTVIRQTADEEIV